MAKITETIKNYFSPKKIAFRIGGGKVSSRKSFFKEQGQVDFVDDFSKLEVIGGIADRKYVKRIKKVPYNYNLYLLSYKKVPKIFRAMNTRAEYAVQAGFKLIGNEADIEKLEEWMRKVHFDNILIQIAKEMLLFGNVFVQPIGSGLETDIKFLPVETMRIVREPTGEHLGFCQIHRNKLIARWKPDEIVHFKWNSIGSEAYGVPELSCLLASLEDKLEIENIIEPLIKYHLENRVIFRCGSPEKPYNTTHMGEFKGTLEDRKIGGDLLVPGDVNPTVIQAGSRIGDLIKLIDHVESQVNTGAYLPQILIEGRSDSAASLIQMDAIERNVKTIQDVQGMGVERGLFTRVLGKDDVPLIKWNPMNIDYLLRLARTLRQLVGDSKAPPIITIDEARDMIGYKPAPEELKFTPEPEKEGEDEPEQPLGGQDDSQRGGEES